MLLNLSAWTMVASAAVLFSRPEGYLHSIVSEWRGERIARSVVRQEWAKMVQGKAVLGDPSIPPQVVEFVDYNPIAPASKLSQIPYWGGTRASQSLCSIVRTGTSRRRASRPLPRSAQTSKGSSGKCIGIFSPTRLGVRPSSGLALVPKPASRGWRPGCVASCLGTSTLCSPVTRSGPNG